MTARRNSRVGRAPGSPARQSAVRRILTEELRVSITWRDGRWLIAKHTAKAEANNLRRVGKWLENNRTLIGKKTGGQYRVIVPSIHDWDAKTRVLTMEFFRGQNLEAALARNDLTRRFYVLLLADLLAWMREKALYWRDFAPRNVLYSERSNTICLVDFESPLRIGRRSMTLRRHSLYCQSKVILELSPVLFPREQRLVCPNIWKHCRRGRLRIADVDGRRRRQFVQTLYPGKATILHADLALIQQRIAAILTPFRHADSVFYPLDALSGIADIDLYVSTVLKLERQPRRCWPSIIKGALRAAERMR